MSDFEIGQKVVCVDSFPSPFGRGQVVTVSSVDGPFVGFKERGEEHPEWHEMRFQPKPIETGDWVVTTDADEVEHARDVTLGKPYKVTDKDVAVVCFRDDAEDPRSRLARPYFVVDPDLWAQAHPKPASPVFKVGDKVVYKHDPERTQVIWFRESPFYVVHETRDGIIVLTDDDGDTYGRSTDAFRLYDPERDAKVAGPSPQEDQETHDPITQPHHYARYKIEPITFIMENNLPFTVGNVVKYVLRYDAKNGLEDLRKAKRYVEMLIEQTERAERGVDPTVTL